jgi:hypothetical protein
MILLVGLGLLVSGRQLQFRQEWIFYIHQEGLGFNNKGWHNSGLIGQIRTLPPETPIYSNGPDVIYFLSDRFAFFLPNKSNPIDLTNYGNYISNLKKIGDQMRDKQGVFVFFKTISRTYLPSEEEILGQLSLEIVAQENDW